MSQTDFEKFKMSVNLSEKVSFKIVIPPQKE